MGATRMKVKPATRSIPLRRRRGSREALLRMKGERKGGRGLWPLDEGGLQRPLRLGLGLDFLAFFAALATLRLALPFFAIFLTAFLGFARFVFVATLRAFAASRRAW